jgi:hypothetical protein
MEGKKLRIVTVDEQFENQSPTPVSFSKSIREILPPDRNRRIYETRTVNGIERIEYIDIGEKSFMRRNDGEWEIYAPTGMGMGNGSGYEDGIPKVEITTVKTLTRGETINNQTVDLYKTVVSKKFIYPTKTFTEISTESFWFDRSGKMLKSIREFQDGARNSLSRTTVEYEYNPNLKIEEPRVKNKPKAQVKR